MSRSTASRVLVVIGGLLLAVGVVAGFIRDTVVDSEEFGDRAAEAYESPEVRAALTEQIVDGLIEVEPELLTMRPLLGTVVDGVLGSDLATEAFQASIVDLHRTVFGAGSDTTTLRIADVLLLAKTQLSTISPELGALIPDQLTDAIVAIRSEDFTVDALQFSDNLQLLAVLFPIGSLAAFVAAVWLSRDPARTVVHIGAAMITAAAGILVVERLILAALSSSAGDDSEVVDAVWEIFVGPLGNWLLTLAGLGMLIAASAWFGLGELDTRPLLDRIGSWTRPSDLTVVGRLSRGAVAVLIGVVLIREPIVVVQIVLTLMGATLIGLGLREIVLTAMPRLSEGVAVADEEPVGEHVADTHRRGAGRWVIIGLLVVVGLLATAASWRSGGTGVVAADDGGCNGIERSCDRRLDEVVFAATHNSNAAARDGYTLGYQTDGIVPQLEDGIRGLLIDVYFGRQVEDDVVVTDRAPLSGDERDEYVEQYGESAVRSAESMAQAADLVGVPRELFLCHAFCELGATDFVAELGQIREFLDDHPGEVVVMIIQDEGPRPGDVAAAFDQSGMSDLVIALDLQAPMPTLGEMVEAGTRVVVAAENNSGEFDWYHDAFALTQDTPFKFESVDGFTCELNRGEPGNPLFLVNHWISPVSPTAADTANSADVLDERVADCLDVRERIPNLIAVDFHDRGDLLAVVERLNGE